MTNEELQSKLVLAEAQVAMMRDALNEWIFVHRTIERFKRVLGDPPRGIFDGPIKNTTAALEVTRFQKSPLDELGKF